MRIDLYGITFDGPAVTYYLWSPWRCTALEHRLFEVVRALPRAGWAQLPAPAEYLGHRAGADKKLVPWTKIEGYFRKAPDTGRVRIQELGLSTEGRRMMIAPRDQRCACRRAQRGRVKAIKAQSISRKLIHRRRWDAATERGVLSEAAIVNEDQQNVRCTFWSLHHLRKLSLVGIEIGATNPAGETKVRLRQNLGSARCRLRDNVRTK